MKPIEDKKTLVWPPNGKNSEQIEKENLKKFTIRHKIVGSH